MDNFTAEVGVFEGIAGEAHVALEEERSDRPICTCELDTPVQCRFRVPGYRLTELVQLPVLDDLVVEIHPEQVDGCPKPAAVIDGTEFQIA